MVHLSIKFYPEMLFSFHAALLRKLVNALLWVRQISSKQIMKCVRYRKKITVSNKLDLDMFRCFGHVLKVGQKETVNNCVQ